MRESTPLRENLHRFLSGGIAKKYFPGCLIVLIASAIFEAWGLIFGLLPDERMSINATATIECQTLDVKSSATELGVCEETVRRLVRRKVLRKLPGLRRILIPRAEVRRYLESGEGGLSMKTLSKSGPEVAQKKMLFA